MSRSAFGNGLDLQDAAIIDQVFVIIVIRIGVLSAVMLLLAANNGEAQTVDTLDQNDIVELTTKQVSRHTVTMLLVVSVLRQAIQG